MKVLFFLFFIAVVVSAERWKRNLWYIFVDDYGNPVPGNTYTPEVFDSNSIPRYPVVYQWPVHTIQPVHDNSNILTEQNVHSTRVVHQLAQDSQSNIVGNPLKICAEGEFQCSSPKQCISKEKRCDNYVDCTDATDETNCTCTSRLDPRKLCDSYYDCPNGEDELGCFGCNEDEYSCYKNEMEYESSNIQQCYKQIHKCDRVFTCSNGKDEIDCFTIAQEVQSSADLLVPTTNGGILYFNYGDHKYPVCVDDTGLSRTACKQMLGANFRDVETKYETTSYDGLYVSNVYFEDTAILKFSFENKCSRSNSSNVVLRVNCTRKSVCGDYRVQSDHAGDSSRIAGGYEAIPGSSPWLVGQFMNGSFTCGGNIISNKWVLTAAHCLYFRDVRFSKYDYLEVRAGIQRLLSFSPSEQAVRVERGMIHEKYERTTLQYDIALLELENTLAFNKWVQPICLPSSELVGDSTDRGWILGAHDSICKIAGWVGHTWRGPSPVDRQMEVMVPIVSSCVPNNTQTICAGYEKGGFDSCAGDSGGPFVCRSKANNDNIYLAGVASGGYNAHATDSKEVHCGEKETYGTYTGLTWFIPWIEKVEQLNDTYGIRFRRDCPGVKCHSPNHCAIRNGIVDCIDGQDEL